MCTRVRPRPASTGCRIATGDGPRIAHRDCAAFTLIELLVVMAIIATLLTLAVPRYFKSIDRSKEAVLMENLRVMRSSIDQFYADNDRYPDTLATLAEKRYLRAVPLDPMTNSATSWVVVPPPGDAGRGVVYDVRSGAPGTALDGTAYSEW
jgi:general secretion pathway protein G